MFTSITRRAARLSAGARLRQITAALAAATAAVFLDRARTSRRAASITG